MKYAIRITIFSIVIFSIMSYWGIRSSDCEVMFRTTEALATKGSFAVSDELPWTGFGLSKGKDGKFYSLFGPGEAIAAVPLYKIAEIINRTAWYQNAHSLVSISHYVNDDLLDFIKGNTPQDLAPHALRTVVSFFNIIISSMCVFVFFFIIKTLTQSDQTALLTTSLFAFGSLILPYSGTFFSEPLANFFVMLSFYILIYNNLINNSHTSLCLLASGIFLGLAMATHITAILFAPFFCIYSAFLGRKNTHTSIKVILLNVSLFLVGFGLLLALIGYYNFVRFGNVIETGRAVGMYIYSTFVAPWRGLWGLLFGAGKGLLFFCPAIILSLIFWPRFHRKYRILSLTILGAALLRTIFIASRSDWHGGFCVGPRYMVVLIPFLMLPIGELIDEMIRSRNLKAIFLFAFFSFICIAQQMYFSLGEIFSFLHSIKWQGMSAGVNVFKNNFLYLSWDLSPLLYLLNGYRGPLLLNFVKLDNYSLWFSITLVAGLLLLLLYFYTLKENMLAQNETINEENKH